ncbi:radical SAM protein [Candidatus Bipolaricaulota bacterium]|nr:radical SAM protein [Candidatus Bipolaricaulota bacterium]
MTKLTAHELLLLFKKLHDCTLCPRVCHADRSTSELGYCQSGVGYSIGSICLHHGEEPILSGKNGICNVFFTRCNMQCRFCQNYQISRNNGPIHEQRLTLAGVVDQIERILDRGATSVGFVSPSHFIPQMMAIIASLEQRGRKATFVMNTNAYDKVETLAMLGGAIDVYLPDLKYMDERLALEYSDAPNYPQVATRALTEMFRQKGAKIELDENDTIRCGLIIRHLVLPGQVKNSIQCLRFIAEELSPNVHLSLMAQYHPIPAVSSHPTLSRTLRQEEYEEVLCEMDRLGFNRGFIQSLESPLVYLPDFSHPHPFEAR